MGRADVSVVLSPEADDDLVSIWQYGADEWSPEQADKHLLEIEVICDRLFDDPELGRLRDDLITGMRSTFIRPHVVFYRLSKGNVEIARVLHQREDADVVFRGI